MTDKPTLTTFDLAQFIGTTQYFRHPIARTILITEGVKYVADAGAAYWLVDEIVFAQSIKYVAAEEFQHWTLTVSPDHSAILECGDGDRNIVFNKSIPFTDFPMEDISIYYTNNVILLPSEY